MRNEYNTTRVRDDSNDIATNDDPLANLQSHEEIHNDMAEYKGDIINNKAQGTFQKVVLLLLTTVLISVLC